MLNLTYISSEKRKLRRRDFRLLRTGPLRAQAQNPARFALADRYFSYEPYALMLRRGDPAFRLAVNRVLARLYRSGQILEVYTRWFGQIGTPSAVLLSLYAIEGLPE